MNVYTQLTEALVPYLHGGLAALHYDPLVVTAGVWKPRALPEFDRYYVQVAPPLSGLWTERRISIKETQYVLRADVFLLVKNYGEAQSLYGETEPDLGLFQLISDVKDLLRTTDLGGLVSLTGNETAGDTTFEAGAASGFETGPRTWVHRARVPYTASMEPFCPPS